MMPRLLIIIVSFLVLVSCSSDPTSPEQQVRNSLLAMETAAQERSMSDFMSYISDDYYDQQGNNKDSLKRLLRVLFLRNQKINIFYVVRSLEIKNGKAKADISAAMTSREVDLSQEKNRLKADTIRFTMTLLQNKNSDDWLIQTADWKRGW